MTPKRWHLFAPLLLLLAAVPQAAPAPRPNAGSPAGPGLPRLVRIAVPYYEDLVKTHNEYQELFSGKGSPEQPFAVDVVVGTYDDVLHWYQKGLVDMAVLPPGAVADMLTTPEFRLRDDMRAKLQRLYVGTRALIRGPGGRQPFADPGPAGEVRFKYKAYCVVPRYWPRSEGSPAEEVPINNFSDVMELARRDQMKFLFVHPLSVSGRILPEYLLLSNNVEVGPGNMEWTYNHKLSLKRLSEWKGGKIPAAFVWDAVSVDGEDAKNLYNEKTVKRIMISEVDGVTPRGVPGGAPARTRDFDIPQEILVKTPKFAETYRDFNLQTLMPGGHRDARPRFKELPGWLSDYGELLGWVTYLKEHPPHGMKQRPLLTTSFTDIDQIIARLRNYNLSHADDPEHPLRLAVVLSGGGAKCSYQLGVMEALESKLRALRIEQYRNGEAETDISLVVGTSGGAINALAVALGLTREDESRLEITAGQSNTPAPSRAGPDGGRNKGGEDRRARLRETWRSFTQRDFVELWQPVHITFGIGVGVVQAALVIFLCMMRVRWRAYWWAAAGNLILALSAVNLFVWNYPDVLFDLAGDYLLDHFWQHVWTVMTLSVGWSALCLFFVGGTLCMLGRRMPVAEDENAEEVFFNLHRRKILLGLLCGIVLSQFAWMTLLFRNAAVSNSESFGKILSQRFSDLVVWKESKLAGAESSLGDRKKLSAEIIDRRLLERDLIITGSRLSTPKESMTVEELDLNSTLPSDLYFYDAFDLNSTLPSDLYFYYTRDASKAPDRDTPPDPRFIPLNTEVNNRALLDVVVGSSSIYPLFPPREVTVRNGETGAEQTIALIDGGFVHNSPLEAAVKWGATHIIVIEASPSAQPTLQTGLMANSLTAFNYLFSQAQNLDAKMYGQKEVFIIRPEGPKGPGDPDLDTFDFSSRLIDRAIDRGLNDTLNTTRPRFQRVFAQPTF